MRRYEKILLGSAILILLLRLWPAFAWGHGLFLLSSWTLGLSYLFRGNWLFNISGEEERTIPTIAGVCFGLAVMTIPFKLSLRQDILYTVLSAFNVLFLVSLAIYLVVNRHQTDLIALRRPLLVRSTIIFLIVGFLTYLPVSSSVYRSTLMAFNSGNERLVSNLLMFDHRDDFKESFFIGDCESSIIHAEKAVNAGLNWLDYPFDLIELRRLEAQNTGRDGVVSHPSSGDVMHTSGMSPIYNELDNIKGTFYNLYEAYECFANQLFNEGDVDKALDYYLMADQVLTLSRPSSEYWLVEQANSMNSMALCHTALGNFDYADSLFLEAISTYQHVKDTTDANVAQFVVNVAKSMSAQGFFEESNILFDSALEIFNRDTMHSDYDRHVVTVYQGLIRDCLQMDSLDKAMRLAESTYAHLEEGTSDYCSTKLYHGIAYYKANEYRRADSLLNEALACYKQFGDPMNQNLASCLRVLSMVDMARAQFDSARVHIEVALTITLDRYSFESVKYADCQRVGAALNMELGHYAKAEQDYREVIEIYTHEFGDDDFRLVEPFSELSELMTVLFRFVEAKDLSDLSMSLAEKVSELRTTSATVLINRAAYISYCVAENEQAEALYRDVLQIEKRRTMSPSAATALNGLGLIALDNGGYDAADSLFRLSLKMHEDIFTDYHPSTAVVKLNHAMLKIAEGELEEAYSLLYSARETNEQFFDSGHDVFADISVAFGDLAVKRGGYESARTHYQKAIDIYEQKFDSEHGKILLTKVKLSRISPLSAQ